MCPLLGCVRSPTKALAKVCLFVDEDFGGDHVSERHEHLEYVLVSKLLRQVVDEQVGTFGTCRDETQPECGVSVGVCVFFCFFLKAH